MINSQIATMILNEKQQHALDLVKNGKNVFITGSAGVGKSLIIEHIRNWCHDNNKNIMVTAMTGVAASNVNGTTLHGWAGIGLGQSKKNDMTSDELEHEIRKRCYYLKKNEAAYSRYIDTDLLIVDEVSMMDYRFIGKVNSIAKILRKSSMPFGGMQLVFTGDFFQLGPVQKDRKTTKFVFEDDIWNELMNECVHLTEVYRQKSTEFIDMLHRIRTGDIDDDLIKKIQNTASNKLQNDDGIAPTVLFCKNVNVDAMNLRGIATLKGKEHTFPAIDTFLDDTNKDLYNGAFTYAKSLTLKVGAQVMLIKNLDIEKKLVNGSRGVVTDIVEDDPITCPGGRVTVKFMDGREHIIKPDMQKFTDDPTQGSTQAPVLAQRIQYPLKLAYALTIHKSQGLSIDYLHVDLSGAFSSGQAYVALSRATSFDTLRVSNFSKKCVITNQQVRDFYERIGRGDTTIKRPRTSGQIETYFSTKRVKT